MPSNALAARVFIPTKKPFSNYINQDRGINWTLTTLEDNSLAISVAYYTLAVKYSISSQYVGKVILFDEEVPYRIYYQ